MLLNYFRYAMFFFSIFFDFFSRCVDEVVIGAPYAVTKELMDHFKVFLNFKMFTFFISMHTTLKIRVYNYVLSKFYVKGLPGCENTLKGVHPSWILQTFSKDFISQFTYSTP